MHQDLVSFIYINSIRIISKYKIADLNLFLGKTLDESGILYEKTELFRVSYTQRILRYYGLKRIKKLGELTIDYLNLKEVILILLL